MMNTPIDWVKDEDDEDGKPRLQSHAEFARRRRPSSRGAIGAAERSAEIRKIQDRAEYSS